MKEEEKNVKLNLGCGDRKIHGFVNVDIRPEVFPDVVCDIAQISEKFSGVSLIYAAHVLEHFPSHPHSFYPVTYREVSQDWYHALARNGILRLSVPDMRAVFERYQETGDLLEVMSFLVGGQKYDHDFHLFAWDFELLNKVLKRVGFREVRRYDWRKTEHFYIDDYSQSFLPHMQKETGKLMSLNVEAVK